MVEDIPWLDDAIRLIDNTKGFRVRAFRLNALQRDQLEAATGQAAMLFGIPVLSASPTQGDDHAC